MNIHKWIKDTLGHIVSPVVIELGANTGTDTVKFLSYLNNPKVICVEPDSRNIQRLLERNLPVHIVPCAIGMTDGFSLLYKSVTNQKKQAWSCSSSIHLPHANPNRNGITFDTTGTTVQTITLDTLISQLSITHADLIWADIQGAEEDMILGGEKTFKITDFVYTEYSNSVLFQNQINLDKILELLPHFEALDIGNPLAIFSDVLLKRKQ